MKQKFALIAMAACFALSACGAYVGDPPKTEVHKTTQLTPPPSEEVHIYHD
jgi:protein involved in sex pheromone biosynthesis